MKVNFFLFLSLFISAVVAIPFDPETSATSFQTKMAQPIRINDDALLRNTAVSSRQQIPSFIFGLMFIKYFKTMISLTCLVMPTYIPTCIQLFLSNVQVIFVIITCVVSPTNCPCSNFPTSCSISSNSETPTNFHMTETHVQNIRAAIEMVMSNPSARNVDELFNLYIIDNRLGRYYQHVLYSGWARRPAETAFYAPCCIESYTFCPSSKVSDDHHPGQHRI